MNRNNDYVRKAMVKRRKKKKERQRALSSACKGVFGSTDPSLRNIKGEKNTLHYWYV